MNALPNNGHRHEGQTMINISTDKLITFTEAAKLFPPARSGKPVHSSCLWRWATRGIRTRDGRRVKLTVLRVGGRFITSERSIQEFCESLTNVADSDTPAPEIRTPGKRAKAVAAAGRRCELAGV
jgi:hypothetical protein